MESLKQFLQRNKMYLFNVQRLMNECLLYEQS